MDTASVPSQSESAQGTGERGTFAPPPNPERYRECERCGYTFDRDLVLSGSCPACSQPLFSQPTLPGTDELAIRRQRRRRRRRTPA